MLRRRGRFWSISSDPGRVVTAADVPALHRAWVAAQGASLLLRGVDRAVIATAAGSALTQWLGGVPGPGGGRTNGPRVRGRTPRVDDAQGRDTRLINLRTIVARMGDSVIETTVGDGNGPDMRRILNLRQRRSDSPYVDRVWRSVAGGGPMTSVACAHREIVVWRDGERMHVGMRGPETVPSNVDVPAGHTTFGIVLTHGTSMPHLPAAGLVDGAVEFPVSSLGLVLRGEEWAVPSYDGAEEFVDRLVRAGLLVRDPLVDDVLRGATATVGVRSVERRVRATTGLSRGMIRQIERARHAAILLGADVAPLEVVGRLGYSDHPHLARSMTRFVGHHASWLRAPDAALSLPYKAD